jgi:hypothetical protein
MPKSKSKGKSKTIKQSQSVKQNVVVNVNTGKSTSRRQSSNRKAFTKGMSYLGSTPMRQMFPSAPSITTVINNPQPIFSSDVVNRVSALENLQKSQITAQQQAQSVVVPMATATPTANQPINAPTLPIATPSPTPSPTFEPATVEKNPLFNSKDDDELSLPDDNQVYAQTPMIDRGLNKKLRFEDDSPLSINMKPPSSPFDREPSLEAEITDAPLPKPSPSPVKQLAKMFEEKSKPSTSSMPEVESPVKDTPKKTTRKTKPSSPIVSEPDEIKGVSNNTVHMKLQDMRQRLGEYGIKFRGAIPGVRHRDKLINKYKEYNELLNVTKNKI